MNRDRHRLRAVAEAVAARFAREPTVSTVLLCGSVARGWDDAWSDVELVVCGETALPPEVRERIASEIGATGRRVFPGHEAVEEEFGVAGVKVDLAFVSEAAIGAIIEDVTQRADTNPRRHAIVAGIRDGVVLHGGSDVERWQVQAQTYPADLQVALIRRSLIFGPQLWLEMLATRDDVLALHVLLARVGQALVAIALALNRTYAMSDSGKWAMRQIAGLEVAPAHFGERLRGMLQADPRTAVAEAGLLIGEMIALVQTHIPAVDVEPVQRRIGRSRMGGAAPANPVPD